MKYKESNLSKQLMMNNIDIMLLSKVPYLMKDKGGYYKCLYFIHKIRELYYHKIKYRKIYDKKIKHKNDYWNLENYTKEIDEIPKVAIYTCILGDYDYIYEPFYKSPNCDYYAITNFDLPVNSRWKQLNAYDFLPSRFKNLDYASINRYFKMHPHLVFPKYDVSIYIDGNITIVADLMPIVLDCPHDKFLGIHNHPDRNKICTEALAIEHLKRTSKISQVKQQVQRYYDAGYNDEMGLLEATILLRRHNDRKCIKVMSDWWNEYIAGSPRDQISLPYVLWKNNITKNDIYILGENLRLNPRFKYNLHK